MTDIGTFNYSLNRINIVSNEHELDRKLPCLEFNLGDPSVFPSGRAQNSRLIFTEDSSYVRDGTLRFPVDQKQFTGENQSLGKEITSNIKVAVIDSILHIYLIGPKPDSTKAPEHANIDPNTVLQLIRFLDGLEPPYNSVPSKIESQFGSN